MIGELREEQPGTQAQHNQVRGRALVVLNPVAGRSVPTADEVRQFISEAFAAAGWEYRLHETTADDKLESLVDEVRREGCSLVVAVGGDGTVAMVANRMIGTDIPVGIIPFGTGNILSLELKIPQDVTPALALMFGNNRVLEMDAMKIGDYHYFLNAGIGLPAAVMRDTSREDKQRLGMLAYARTALQKIASHRLSRFTINVDGRKSRMRASAIMVANAGAMGSADLRFGQEVHADDGELDLVIWRVRNWRDYLKFFWELLVDVPKRGDTVVHERIKQRVIIRPHEPLPIQADGEAIGEGTLDITVVPKALRIIAAPEPEDNGIGAASQAEVEQARIVQAQLKPFLGPTGMLDTSVFFWMSGLPHPRAVNTFMRSLSAIMSKGMAWAIGLFIASRINPKRGKPALADILPGMWLAGLSVEFPIKRLFNRTRPFEAIAAAQVVGQKPSGYSFPSAHTAVSFAAALLMSRHYPHRRGLLYGLASLVGFSRLYLGAHYLTDVISGAILGAGIAGAYRFVRDRLVKRKRRRWW